MSVEALLSELMDDPALLQEREQLTKEKEEALQNTQSLSEELQVCFGDSQGNFHCYVIA